MIDLAALKDQLITHEGLRTKPYWDTASPPRLTIAVGRNLSDVGLSREECLYLLDNDIKKVIDQLDHFLPWWHKLNDVRQRVLIDMCFMGIGKLLGFKKALAAIESANWQRAHDEMLNSAWAGQVKGRATTLAKMMLSGENV